MAPGHIRVLCHTVTEYIKEYCFRGCFAFQPCENPFLLLAEI